ncbi:MAG: FAD-binding oxidoreductase [Deltaproteobacteria bacterium]|nr:FAD-binding oxidoreductase [Deltaproteobacteria bacterium]
MLPAAYGSAQKLLGILSAKCPVFKGLLRTAYAKLFLYDPYERFQKEIEQFIPKTNIITSPLWTLAYGTDASFYRLIPKIVVNIENEDQVVELLKCANRLRLAVTFRAAGTSLSGQSITDSILVRLGLGWRNYQILENANKIKLESGIIGGQANRWLAVYGKKIGPDPASIDTAKIGGILANNASGMCCGVAQNSYQTIDSMRIILIDGSVVDTADPQSRQSFQQIHGDILTGLSDLRNQVLTDKDLAARIRHKFKIKNTSGYSLNALVDYADPFEIMQHLLIGSEGTLGFISEVIYKTVTEHSFKASTLILFPDMKTACQAIPLLKPEPVAAAELMDRASLKSVEHKEGLPDYLKTLGPTVTALLVETQASSQTELDEQTRRITSTLNVLESLRPIQFTDVADEYAVLWNIRKGLFPAVGAMREIGTTVIIEDVAFPIAHLASAALDLQDLFSKYDYNEAIIFGHALEGNLHFVFTQDFSSKAEVTRYRNLMEDVVDLVVARYDGSLKAEHGTGRNMAPFVEKEWGSTAFKLMKAIKSIFDPANLLNPGVILNDDKQIHLKNLKPMPSTHEIVDRCTECGFCEPICPSKDLTFTPRQRIVGRREISRLMRLKKDSNHIAQLIKSYTYPGSDTCATDGLCGTRCPVEIDTGKLVKHLRQEAKSDFANKIAGWTGSHFSTVSKAANVFVSMVNRLHKIAGTPLMKSAAKIARSISGQRIPSWNEEMPSGVPRIRQELINPDNPLKVVYFPSCASRSMSGPPKGSVETDALPQTTIKLLNKAGYEVIFPKELEHLCCGQVYESKGFMDLADQKRSELFKQLWITSDEGQIPVMCDTSPCLYRMKQEPDNRLQLFEPLEFVLTFLTKRLRFEPLDRKIALHLTCSSRKMGLDSQIVELARLCAKEVVVPDDLYCCGFAGDRGFNFPELNASALGQLKQQVDTCDVGYSTSITCEIGLALHGGIPYRSILNLVNEASKSLAESSR